jgi:hypothetical protein
MAEKSKTGGKAMIRNGGGFLGTLDAATIKANTIITDGAHEVSSNNALNIKIVAFDNTRVVTNRIIRWEDFSGGVSTYAAKRIRVAGKGYVKFYIRYQGRVAIFRLAGTNIFDSLFNFTQLADNSTETGVWTAEKYLPDDINIIYLEGADSHLSSSTKFINTTFEVRTSSEPGLFKYLSSPF